MICLCPEVVKTVVKTVQMTVSMMGMSVVSQKNGQKLVQNRTWIARREVKRLGP